MKKQNKSRSILSIKDMTEIKNAPIVKKEFTLKIIRRKGEKK